MKRDNVNYLVVGVFVLVILAAFLALMFKVSGRGGPSDRYYVYYSNVTGLKFGTGVFYEGYQVGQVERIKPVQMERGVRYKLALSVEEGWRIPADSTAAVVASGLISQVQIQIEQGQSDAILEPGSEIRGVEQQDLFSALSAAASGFNDLSQTGVAPVLQNLNLRISQVADEIIDFRRTELGPLVRNLDQRVNQELAPQAASTLASLDASAQRLARILGPENEQRIGGLLVHVDTVAVELTGLIARIELTRQEMNGVLRGLDGLVASNDEEIGATVDSARDALQRLESSLTTIDQNIETVMYHLEGSAQQTHELTRALRQNPSRLLRGSSSAASNPPP